MNTINIKIGQRLQEKRKAKKLKQLNVANTMGLSRTSIVNIEKGRQACSIAHLIKFCELYETHPILILDGLVATSIADSYAKDIVDSILS